MTTPSLDIRLLGPVEILVDGSPLDVDTRKAVALLSYLACSSGPLPRDRAMLLLWPDAGIDSARGSLRRTLSALRKGLGGAWLGTDRREISLEPGAGVDAVRFESLAASHDVTDLDAAAALYRGDFMQGFALRDSGEFDDWQMQQANTYRRLSSTVFERLSEAHEDDGALGEAIEAAVHWLALDPLHEPAHRRLMLLYARAGDRNAAVRQYRECVRVFQEELGVPPLDETNELYRRIIEGDRAELVALPPIPVLLPAPRTGFVGREADLAALNAAYERAGDSLVGVLVVGEPGIGKTRLVEEFVEERPTVLRVVAHRAERAVPYGIVVEIIRAGLALEGAAGRLADIPEQWLVESSRLVPELTEAIEELPEPGPLEGPGGHRRMLEATARVVLGLTAGAEPGVIVVDDAQWCDPASVEVLALLTNRIRGATGLLVLALRMDAVPDGHPLDDLRLGRIELARLDVSDVAALLAEESPELDGHAAELHRVSEGVPFILVEYLGALARGDDLAELPGGVQALLQERLDGLSGVAVQVAGAASVLQRSFGFEDLHEVAGRTEGETLDAVEELVRAGVIVEVEDDGFVFGHERLQQYAYESMSSVRRRLLHGRAADSLMATASSSLDAAVTAEHLVAAGRGDEAAQQHLVAADAAGALYANDDALSHYEEALALGHAEVGRIQEAMAELRLLDGDYRLALAGFETAAAGAAGPDLGRIEAKIAAVHSRLGQWESADAHFEAAMASAGDEPAAASRTLAAWASAAHRAGDAEHANALAMRALDDATLADDRLALAEAHNVLGIVQRADDPDAARRHHEVAIDLVGDLSPVIRAAALNNLALTHLAAGTPDDGLAAAHEALALTRRVGDRHRTAAVHNNIADLYHAAGRDGDAIDHLKEAAAIFSEIGSGGDELQPEIWMLSQW
jgi:DNA-binding SARP family transcriptional activator